MYNDKGSISDKGPESLGASVKTVCCPGSVLRVSAAAEALWLMV